MHFREIVRNFCDGRWMVRQERSDELCCKCLAKVFKLQHVDSGESSKVLEAGEWPDYYVCFYNTNPDRTKRMSQKGKFLGQGHQGEGCSYLLQVRVNRLDGGANFTYLQRESS